VTAVDRIATGHQKPVQYLERTMKAIVRSRYGSPDVLQLIEVAKPAPKGDEVLVRVHAASVNAGDLDYLYGRPLFGRMFTGLRHPRNHRLGLDVAGQVEATGEEVKSVHSGDEVFGDMTSYGFGAFAEYVCAPEKAFAPKPVGMTFEEAATVPQAAILALQGLRGKRQLQPGARVLINGAGGSVGTFAVQIAKYFGAEVTGVDSTSKLDLVRSIGADHVMDYTREDFTKSGQRYDRILDIWGRSSIFDYRRALSPTGTYAMVGGSTGRIFQVLILGPLISMNERKTMGLMWWRGFRKEDVEFLTELIGGGKVSPVIDRRFHLSEVPDALRYLEAGHAQGKLVITV
jgi:NADPH:quinone reductase-like Zn-dependent oxidoreductase